MRVVIAAVAVAVASCAGSRSPSGDVAAVAPAPVADAGSDADGLDAATMVPIADADRVVAGLRPQFRTCYQTGLAIDRNMEGKVILTAQVSAEGGVLSVTPGEPAGLSPSVVTCMAGVLKRAQFAAPGGRSTLAVPVVFKHQIEPKTKRDTF